ncbi:uncharacterized protein LOC116342713 [Contarinia nasturtii]|uniref:uncharacterized protein LOC116342713 n=1 Tax=Contarinia nasturtii TaxID=265458 RepID=UPI0012D3AB39|nr:uncharacterized protein LOC116342713 [Contarinia nasturtii]
MRLFIILGIVILAMDLAQAGRTKGKSENEIVNEHVSAMLPPYLSGELIEKVEVQRNLENVNHLFNNTFAAEWMQKCCGMEGNYADIVIRIQSINCTQKDEFAVSSTLETINAAINEFNKEYEKRLYTKSYLKKHMKEFHAIAELLHEMHENGERNKRVLIEKACVDMHTAMCWMRTGVVRSPPKSNSFKKTRISS